MDCGPGSMFEEGMWEQKEGAGMRQKAPAEKASPGQKRWKPSHLTQADSTTRGGCIHLFTYPHRFSLRLFLPLMHLHGFTPTLEGLQGKEAYLSDSESAPSERAVTRKSGDLGSGWSDTA